MNINIYPKYYVENDRDYVKNRILISIIGDVESSLEMEVKDRYKDVLELRFCDLDFVPSKDHDLYGLSVFDSEKYYKIKDFIEEYKNENIDIHCSAGVSRSSAVAIGICFIKNDIELFKNTIKNHKNMRPNELVLSIFKMLASLTKTGLSIRNMNWYINYYHNNNSQGSYPDEYIHEELISVSSLVSI